MQSARTLCVPHPIVYDDRGVTLQVDSAAATNKTRDLVYRISSAQKGSIQTVSDARALDKGAYMV